MFKTITKKLLVLVVVTGLVPLLFFGVYTIFQSQKTSEKTIMQANEKIAQEIVDQVQQYLKNAQYLIESLANSFVDVRLSSEQKEIMLRNYAMQFDQFKAIHIIDDKGVVSYSSSYDKDIKSFSKDPIFRQAMNGELAVSKVFLGKELRPLVGLGVPLRDMNQIIGIVYAEVNLFHLWKIVEDLKIGKNGFLSLLTDDGRIFASGSGKQKALAIAMSKYPALKALNNNLGGSFERAEKNKGGSEEFLVVSSVLPKPFSWIVLVEQPTREVYELAADLQRNLLFTIVGMLVICSLMGYQISQKEFIDPFSLIMARIKELSKGNLKGKVDVPGQGEFKDLAVTLNEMSEQLIVFQKRVVNEEKMSMLGRVASHLAHDIKHPIQNIDNYFRMLLRDPANKEYMDLFSQTVTREIGKMNGFLDNFRNLSKDIPFVPVHENVDRVIDEVLMGVMPECEQKGVDVKKDFETDCMIELDLMQFNRLISNLVKNALEAMPEGGCLSIQSFKTYQQLGFPKGAVAIKISDTGVGIPQNKLEEVFGDFMSTKSSGIGLGLAITKRIVYLHSGDIEVESEVGKGTSFILYFPVIEMVQVSA